MRINSNLAAHACLAAAGLLWALASADYAAWTEFWWCGPFTAGFILVVGDHLRPTRFVRPAALAAAVLATSRWALQSLSADSLIAPMSWGLLAVGILALLALTVLRQDAGPWLRAGFVSASVGAALVIVASDFAGVSWWTPGNVVALVGGLAGALGPGAAPSQRITGSET
ncbi:MAG TPA: hypothetical protein VI818_03255 [Candidatus Thermoplasmatota archaeon]|nr:hypothetical protein [Candidatus Thermoplasmatota archaeon]